jgi:hypothetical protein
MSDVIHLDQFRSGRRTAMIQSIEQKQVAEFAKSIVRRRTSGKERRKLWFNVKLVVKFYECLRGLGHVASAAHMYAELAAAKPYKDLEDMELLNAVIDARLALLLTPAPTKMALKEKRRLSQRWLWRFEKSQQRKVERQLADDEEWLRVNARPGRRGRIGVE